MDARLFRIGGHRPESLTDVDLPVVAKAIVATIRGVAKAGRGFARGIPYVRLFAPGVNVFIRGDEWEQIAPFLENGTLDPVKFPTPSIHPIDRTHYYDVSTIATNDPVLYQRVLAVLGQLFTRKFRTSNL